MSSRGAPPPGRNRKPADQLVVVAVTTIMFVCFVGFCPKHWCETTSPSLNHLGYFSTFTAAVARFTIGPGKIPRISIPARHAYSDRRAGCEVRMGDKSE